MKQTLVELKVFEHSDFGSIRTVRDTEGQVLFSGNDIAKALGYSNPRDALRRHCRAVVKQAATIIGKIQEISYIYEPDLYRLMAKSKLPAAIAFENWLFGDLLPTLRRHGMYAFDAVLESEEKLEEAVAQLRAEREQAKQQHEQYAELQQKCQQLLETIEQQRPLSDYAAEVLRGDLDMTATQIAADYDISAIRLNNLLHEAGLQRKVNGQWVLYAKYLNRGLVSSHTTSQTGHSNIQTRWTQEGRFVIHHIMEMAGIRPVNR